MYKIPANIIIVLSVIVIISCNENKNADTSKLPVEMDDSSSVIIDRAIAYAGGYESWQQMKTLSFDKKITSYDSTGKVIREIDQHLDYMMNPEFKAKITYRLSDTSITLQHDGQRARKSYNSNISAEQKDIDAAWNSCFGSQFVMSMPFKLKDPGIKAEYAGEVTMADGIRAQVIKTSYLKGAGSNSDHIWYYYIEPGTGKLLANSLNGKNNFWDYTRYDHFEKANGLLMPALRTGYTADSLNKPGKLISKTRHYNIVFNKELPADHFEIKDRN